MANAMAGSPFEYVYTAASGKLPQDSSPQWGTRGRAEKIAELREGRLVVDVPSTQRAFFVIGHTDDGSAYGATEAWNMASGEATVEFRFRGKADNPEFEVFQVQISDGRKQWRIRFFNDRIFPLDKNIDISEPDTYRATLKDGLLTLTSARQGEIFRDRPGSDPADSSKNVKQPANCLWFGTFSPNAQIPDARGDWELEFIRWTNKAALPGPPSE